MLDERQQQLFAPPEPVEKWEAAASGDRLIAEVVLNRPLDDAYYYLVPDRLREMIGIGQRVKVPLGRGNSPTLGYCVGLHAEAPTSRRLKAIHELLDTAPLLSQEMLELTRWIAERYLCSWGQVLESVIPAGVKKQAGTRNITRYRLADDPKRWTDVRLPKKQQAIVDSLVAAAQPLSADELTQAADCGTGPIRSLKSKGILIPLRERVVSGNYATEPISPAPDLELNAAQQAALDAISGSIDADEHATFLLHGVTGSGKTEVYIQAIRQVVAFGRQAIVLVPEISLTPQTIRRFRSRFPAVAVLHSHLPDAERHWHWQQIAEGRVQVVVGARSAVFAPVPDLGLIVIDEEHETTFKQQSTPRYHARDVAQQRAKHEGVPLVLGSATPTLESLHAARSGEMTLLSLPKRVAGRPLPPVMVVDVRNDPRVMRGESIGRALQNTMTAALRDGGQVILFLNLRGYSPVLWCLKCGGGVKCPHCDITLTWHRDRERMLCHSCEFEMPPPASCPECGASALRYLGSGTQRLQREVEVKFEGVPVVRMDSDSMKRPGSHDAALESFRKGETRILLGTQMIAKGLDFPNVTLVGVVNADSILHQPDLRAAERTFQLIAQVAGRTGRGEKGGRVLVQTSSPSEPVILRAAAHDYLGFARDELASRHQLQAPPFSHLARIIVRGPKEDDVRESAQHIAKQFREAAAKLPEEFKKLRILGPAPAQILKLRSHFRYHLQIAAADHGAISLLWNGVRKELAFPEEIEFTIDVDPLDMR